MSSTLVGSSDNPIRVAYVTVRLPGGAGEAFAITELRHLQSAGVDVVIVPVWGTSRVVHEDARPLLSLTLREGLLSGAVLRGAIAQLLRSPRRSAQAVTGILWGTRLRLIPKNLAILAKGLWLAREIRGRGVGHVHAYWASTPASVGFIAASASGAAFSFTAHRWDIGENNALLAKARRASWIRAVSVHGAEKIRGLLPSDVHDRIRVMHLGVAVPPLTRLPGVSPSDSFVIAVPASLLPVKGHAHLLAAIATSKLRHRQGLRVRLFGDGPLRIALQAEIDRLDLQVSVRLEGPVAHERLMSWYSEGQIDLVVLSSITTDDGEHEGIPIALVEAMAHGIPVIATANGGIPELVADGAGILVPERDPAALAEAITSVIDDPALRMTIGQAGRRRIEAEYDVIDTTTRLIAGFRTGGE